MKRKQLTLFLEEKEAQSIETIRRQFNPEQYRLIKSHITLCREDEIEDLEVVQANLAQLRFPCFNLGVGELKRFAEGKGLLISIKDTEEWFQQLRLAVLQNLATKPRVHQAHVTLMHPRNSTCDDQKMKAIQKVPIPRTLRISNISLIEQEIEGRWETLKVYDLDE